MLCLQSFSVPIKGEAMALSGNLLPDAGFEINSGEWIWANGSAQSTGKARSGTYSACLTYPGSGNARVVQNFSGGELKAGATYELRFWMWTADEKADPRVRLTYTGGSVPHTEHSFTAAVGAWKEGVVTFTPDTGVTKVNISIRLYGGSVLYVDDVSLVKTKSGNLLKNGNFEDDASEVWVPVNGALYSGDRAHGGSLSVKLSANDSRVTQSLYAKDGIVPGAEYELRVWTYATSQNVRPRIKLQFGGTNKVETGDLSFAVNTWKENVYTFQVPLGTSRVDVLLRLYEDGILYYDDASLEMVKPAEHVSFSTNEIFYYTDLTEGYVHLKVNKDVYPSYSTFAADVTIKNEKGTVLITKYGQSLSSGSAEIPFDITELDISEKPYTVSCTIRDGTVPLETKEEKIYRRYARPDYLTRDGTFQIDGKPFYPVFGYHVNHKKYDTIFDTATGETLLEAVKATGVNVVQVPAGLIFPDKLETLVQRLDSLEAHGMYGLVCLYPWEYPAGSEVIVPDSGYPQSTAYYVRNMLKYTYVQDGKTKKLIEHPAIFAWGVADEPLSGGFSEKELFDSYILLREADSVHPLFDTENSTGYFETSLKYVDVLGMDDYPYDQWKSISHVEDSTAVGEALAEKSGKATAPILQFFRRSEEKPYFPSGNEMRNMIYQSFFAGAPAFGYFAFDYTVDGVHVMLTDAGKAMRSFAEKEQKLLFDLACSGVYERKDAGETANGAYVWFAGNEKTYIAVRSKNVTGEVSLSVPLGSEKPFVLHNVHGVAEADVTQSTGSLSVHLPPAGTALLELAEAEDLVLLKDGKPADSISPGDTLTLAYYGGEEDILLTIALYAHSDTKSELLEAKFFTEGGATYTVPQHIRGTFSLRAFAWKMGKIQPVSAFANVSGK